MPPRQISNDLGVLHNLQEQPRIATLHALHCLEEVLHARAVRAVCEGVEDEVLRQARHEEFFHVQVGEGTAVDAVLVVLGRFQGRSLCVGVVGQHRELTTNLAESRSPGRVSSRHREADSWHTTSFVQAANREQGVRNRQLGSLGQCDPCCTDE